jgi:hypothetical protein
MTTSTKLIAIKNIEVANRLRKLRPEKVEEIAKSIKAGLLLQPIMVRPKPKGGYLLVYGAHRLEAERQLKSETVECRIVKMTDDQALLAEIDENLCRADLTAAERAIHTRERKKIFEAAHPETKRGSGGGRAKAAKSKGAKGQNGPKQDAYVEDTAKKTGKSRRTVKRDVTRSKIDPQALDDLAGTCLDTGVELDAMAKMSVDEQRDLAARAKAGETVTAVKPKATATESATDPTETATATTATGNDTDAQESAAYATGEADKAAGESNPEKAADQTQAASKALRASARQLAEFKHACDIRLPKLNVHDLVEAIEYATEAYHRILRPDDAPGTTEVPADTAAREAAVQ